MSFITVSVHLLPSQAARPSPRFPDVYLPLLCAHMTAQYPAISSISNGGKYVRRVRKSASLRGETVYDGGCLPGRTENQPRALYDCSEYCGC